MTKTTTAEREKHTNTACGLNAGCRCPQDNRPETQLSAIRDGERVQSINARRAEFQQRRDTDGCLCCPIACTGLTGQSEATPAIIAKR